MTLTWHIIKKDLRRFWPVALFLAFLVLLECYWGFLLLSLSPGDGFDSALFNRISGYSSLLANLQLLAVVIFTAALIHEDGFAGSTKYWMTRPISNRRLLAAKGGTLILLSGVLPPLAAIPWWLYAGWGPEQILWGLAKMGAPACVLALFSAPFALVTSNVSRFLLSILIGLLVFALMGVVFTELSPWSARDLRPALSTSRTFVAGCLLVGVSVSAIIIHLRRDVTSVAMKVLAGGTLAWLVAGVSWPWELPLAAKSNQQESSLTAGITARPDRAEALHPGSSNFFTFRMTFELSGVPAKHYVTGGTQPGQRLVWADTEEAVKVVMPFSTSSAVPHLRELLSVDGDEAKASPTVRFASRLTIERSITDRFRQTPPSYEMVGNFRLLTPLALGEIPLLAGGRIIQSGHTIHILGEQGGFAGRFINLVESKPSPKRTNVFFDFVEPSRVFFQEGVFNHYVINRRLGRIYRGDRPINSTSFFRRCSIAHVEIIWRNLVFREDFDPSQGEDGLENAQELTLASIGSREVATFERRITFPASMFPLP